MLSFITGSLLLYCMNRKMSIFHAVRLIGNAKHNVYSVQQNLTNVLLKNLLILDFNRLFPLEIMLRINNLLRYK